MISIIDEPVVRRNTDNEHLVILTSTASQDNVVLSLGLTCLRHRFNSILKPQISLFLAHKILAKALK